MTKQTSKTHTHTFAALTVSAVAGLAAMAVPMTAQAQSYHAGESYNACKSADKDNQVIGGLIGAVVGGVVGSQVSGNGARTEGSVLGAALGAAAGAGIGDDKRNCRRETGVVRPRTVTYDRGYVPAPTYRTGEYTTGSVVTVRHPHGTRGHNTRTYDRGYYGGHDRIYDRGYDRRDNRLDRIDFRISETRRELDRLRRDARYNGSRYTDRRIEQVGRELRDLKNRRKQIKKGYR
ncbi:glycine zipper 2TM domain-containing protein [Fretibacter rubidus]|uniref:glycine zipper 2TM domain-containing protein n=1 Tax=Fretibacter rubidus TaxID=570162 RepID=UPI00352AD15C